MFFQFKTIATAGLSCIATAILVANFYSSEETVKPDLLTNDLKNKIANLEKENRELIHTRETLTQELAQLRTIKHPTAIEKPVAQSQSSSLSSTSTDNLTQIQSEFETYKNVKKMEDFQRWLFDSLKNSKDFHLGNEMQKRFEAEERNPVWAAEQEQKISTLFVENEELRGAAFKDAKCKSSQCEISIAINSTDEANQIMEKTSKALQSISKDTTVIASHNPEKGFTTLYVTQDEKGFNFN